MSVELARRHRLAQQSLSASVTLDVAALWRLLVGEQGPRPVWPDLEPQLETLIQDRRTMSTRLATRFYRDARLDAGVPGDPPQIVVPRAPRAQLETSLAVTGLVSYERATRAGQSPVRASETAIVSVSGAAERLVQDAGRTAIDDAVQADRRALGWYRLPGPNPCAFCAMLASRGAAYGSKDAATQSEDGTRYHDRCGCVAVPVFSREEALPSEVQRWVDAWDASANTSDPVAAFRQRVDEANASEPAPEPSPAGES